MSLEQREARARSNLPVELVLIRHAEPDWELARQTGCDPGLSSLGRAQAAQTAAGLKALPFAALHCSPLERARETAVAIGKIQGLTSAIEPDLEEIRVPLMTGASQTDVDAYFRSAAQRPFRDHWNGFPGGESFHDFNSRVTSGIQSLLAQYGVHPQTNDGFAVWSTPARAATLRIGVVAHGGTNSVILTHLLGIPSVPWEWIRFETPLAAVSVVALRAFNDQGYIWSLQQFGRRME